MNCLEGERKLSWAMRFKVRKPLFGLIDAWDVACGHPPQGRV
jgi:hypothetical protein